MVTETLLSTIALSLLPDIVYDYLRSWFRPAVEQLLRKEHASEVLVGFVPDLSRQDQQQLLSFSETSVEEKTSALRSAQDSIKERAIDSIGQARPAKNETNLPGTVWQIIKGMEWAVRSSTPSTQPPDTRDPQTNAVIAVLVVG